MCPYLGAKEEEGLVPLSDRTALVDEFMVLRQFSKPLFPVFGLSILLKRYIGKIDSRRGAKNIDLP